MENIKECKGCSASVIVTSEQIKNLINEIIKGQQFDIADDSLYQKRLTECSTCKYLEYGTTCTQCGCIVQIKAKLADSTCPYPKNPKW